MFGGYPPTAIGYPPTAIGYTPTAINYPPAAIGYTPTAISYPPTAIGYPPTAISYPPAAIIGRIGHSEFFIIIMATPGFYGGHSTGYKLGNHPKNIEPCAHRARTVRAPCDNAPFVILWALLLFDNGYFDALSHSGYGTFGFSPSFTNFLPFFAHFHHIHSLLG